MYKPGLLSGGHPRFTGVSAVAMGASSQPEGRIVSKDILALWDGTAKTRAMSFTPSVPRCVMDLGIGLIMLDVGT